MNSELVRATNHLNNTGHCHGWIEQPEEIKSGIYCWTNTVNGKKYVGQSVNLKNRKKSFLNFNNDHYSGIRINNARHKYNTLDCWKYSIIEYCSVDVLDEREVDYIALYNTTSSKIGYNYTDGGSNGLRGELNPRWGVSLSDEMKEKLSIARSIAVCQYDLDGNFIREWQSAKVAGMALGLCYSNINSCCCGRAKSAGQFLWSYKHSDTTPEKYHKPKYKSIYQIDIATGEIIKAFECIKDAADEYGFDLSGIAATCRGRHQSYYGFIWVFQKDYSLAAIKERQNKIERIRNHIVDDETRNLMSERNKGVNNPNYGRKHTDEAKQKISAANKGRKHKAVWNFKAVNQYTKDGVFVRRWESATEAELSLNGKKTGFISKVLKNVKLTAYGYKWEYAI